MTIFDGISLLGGLALFLYGMRIMGDGLKKSSSGTMKKAMEKVTNNSFVGFLLGVVVTALIQSSTATIVLTSGLVGAGIITLHQSIGVIIGANVGTTVTGQIIRLLDIDAGGAAWLNIFTPNTLAPIAAICGILLIMAFSFHNSDLIGNIAMGFGILFFGLINMTSAVSGLKDSAAFASLFTSFAEQPFLGFLAGMGVATLLQSSSASIGILQALAVTGKLSFGAIYAILGGIYMGDCITTAIVCSIGTKADAKRTGIVHILFNISEVIIICVAVAVLRRCGVLAGLWDTALTSGGIANTNTVFKLATAVMLLPICRVFEKLSLKIIKDDSGEEAKLQKELESLDKTFYKSPALAISAAGKVLCSMATRSAGSVMNSMNLLTLYDQKTFDSIAENENYIDALADNVSSYLIHMSPYIGKDQGSDEMNYYMKCVTEFERIGDYAVNISENAAALRDKDSVFSPEAVAELGLLEELIFDIMTYTQKAFVGNDVEAARHIEPLEEVVDDMVEQLRAKHFERLRDGKCNMYVGFIFLDILVNVERISDQCSNVGIYTIALHDPEVEKNEHDYIKRLHAGEDEQFNEEYRAAGKRYAAMLDAMVFAGLPEEPTGAK